MGHGLIDKMARETTCGYVAFCLTIAVNFSLKLQMGTCLREFLKYGSEEKPYVNCFNIFKMH